MFLAGQTGTGETIEDQTEDALGKVAALLDAAGCALADVVSCLVHLANLSEFERFNAVYERHFPEPRPVRTTVGAPRLGGAKVEITAVARQASAPVRRPACHSRTTSSTTRRDSPRASRSMSKR